MPAPRQLVQDVLQRSRFPPSSRSRCQPPMEVVNGRCVSAAHCGPHNVRPNDVDWGINYAGNATVASLTASLELGRWRSGIYLEVNDRRRSGGTRDAIAPARDLRPARVGRSSVAIMAPPDASSGTGAGAWPVWADWRRVEVEAERNVSFDAFWDTSTSLTQTRRQGNGEVR